jgi:hypothetical protein
LQISDCGLRIDGAEITGITGIIVIRGVFIGSVLGSFESGLISLFHGFPIDTNHSFAERMILFLFKKSRIPDSGASGLFRGRRFFMVGT